SRRRHTRFSRDWSSDVCSSDLGAPHRLLHGTIRRASQGATSKRFTYYYLTLAPRLAWLDLRRNVRIFQQQSVPDIVRQLLNEAEIGRASCREDAKNIEIELFIS